MSIETGGTRLCTPAGIKRAKSERDRTPKAIENPVYVNMDGVVTVFDLVFVANQF